MVMPMSRLAQRKQAEGSSLCSLFLFIATFYFFAGAHAQSQGNNFTTDQVNSINQLINNGINEIQQLGQLFASNLFSDLAPFLALFGDQLVREFMSQSRCLPDYIIFSMGPLGITMALIIAVRLCGPTCLKPVIGKGRESMQEAELELTLSTSESVCEVWDGASITRIIGEQNFIELRIEHEGGKSHIKQLRDGQGEDETKMTMPPNLSLNTTEEAISLKTKWGIAIISIFLQVCVLVYAGVVQFILPKPRFQKDGVMGNNRKYAFYTMFFGTLSMNVSMLLCSYAVDKSMNRGPYPVDKSMNRGSCSPPNDPEGEQKIQSWRPCWIQRHGKAGDQFFDSYIIFGTPRSSNDDITTLHPPRVGNGKKKKRLGVLVGLAVLFGFFGFFLQVVGLRELHPSVPTFVFGQTVLMTLLRGVVHLKKNKVHAVKLPQDFELEWLVPRVDSLWGELKKRDELKKWDILKKWDKLKKWYKLGKRDASASPSSGTNASSVPADDFWESKCLETWDVATGEIVIKKEIMMVRLDTKSSTDAASTGQNNLELTMSRLVSLKSSYHKSRESSDLTALSKSMRYVLNTLLHPNIKVRKGGFGLVNPGATRSGQILSFQNKNFTSWNWAILVNTQYGEQPVKQIYVKPTLEAKFPGGWMVTEQVESLFNLWLFSLDQRRQQATPSSGAAGPSPLKLPTFDSIRLLGSNTARARWDILKWYIDHCAQVYEVRLAKTSGEEVQSTEPPRESTEPQEEEVQSTELPRESTEPQEEEVQSTELPRESTEPPRESTEPQEEEVQSTELPRESTELPRESTELPRESTELPRESTELPRESTELPREFSEPPRESTELLRESTEPPRESTEPQEEEVQSTELPKESTEPPEEEVQFTVEKHHGGVMGISDIDRYASCG